MKRFIVSTLLVLFALVTYAQQAVDSLEIDSIDLDVAEEIDDSTIIMPDSLEVDSIMLELARDSSDSVTFEFMSTELDLMNVNYATMGDCPPEKDTVIMTDSLYIARLQALPYIIEMPYNKIVRTYIDLYTERRRQQVANMSALSEYYFPIFEQKLAQYGLPYELRFLPIIESALNCKAYSRAGAAGLWQFMPATGRLYGLEINSLVDERMDVYKATDAACRFLRDLYNIHHDWHLVIAAYNCGSGNIRKATTRSGGKHDYWGIYPYLPAETRGYVPIFIAANYAMNYSDAHKICPNEITLPTPADTIRTNKRLHLKQVADVIDIPIEDLRVLNPQYRMDILPGNKTYSLVLPENKIDSFLVHENEIYAYKADSLINNRRQQIEMAQKSTSYAPNGKYITYKIKSGDTLGSIAKRYHVSVKQLQRWNGLKGTSIRAGRVLKIYKK